ncbi:MAG: hypothetical protein ACR2LK_14960 [Solirubrobacteraceae bacterium]
MYPQDPIAGTLRQYDVPNWRPLVDLVGTVLADWFMWMCEIELADGSRVQAYKHISTRRYLHLDLQGCAFDYTWDGRYQPIPGRVAIELAFLGWETLFPLPDDPSAVANALRHACSAAPDVCR